MTWLIKFYKTLKAATPGFGASLPFLRPTPSLEFLIDITGKSASTPTYFRAGLNTINVDNRYSYRYTPNGAGSTTGSSANHNELTESNAEDHLTHILGSFPPSGSLSSSEDAFAFTTVSEGTSGVDNPPSKIEGVMKFGPTGVSQDANLFEVLPGSGNFGIDSTMFILGDQTGDPDSP